MNRRDLIASAATLAGNQVLASTLRSLTGLGPTASGCIESAPQTAARTRHAPTAALTLRTRELDVVFDPEHGLPYSYRYQGKRLWGEDEGYTITAIVCRLDPRDYQTVAVQPVSMHRTTSDVTFAFRAELAGRPAATFHLRYAVDDASLVVSMESVKEQAGFELIEVALPQLMTVREEEGPAWMAEGRNGGSFVRLDESKAHRFPDDSYFGRISTELPIGMVGQNGIGCVMEVTSYMDGTETEIRGSTGHRHATLGTIQTHRVHGGRCYNMNDGGPFIRGNADTANLVVGQSPRARFDFFACAGQAQPWLGGAKIVRARVPAMPTEFFSDRFLYIVAGKMKIEAEPRTTFAQSKKLVRDVAMLTDRAPQTVFISGWNYDGQDTGYPSEDKINGSLGTYEDLRGLMEAGNRLNANVTLNTNYDDAYKSSPIFDDAFIARCPDGEIWKSREWDGESSYVVGMAKFMEGGWGARRIAYALDRYHLSDSILIDAMSWFAVRNDWDPRHPASGYKNLVDGKYKVVEEFRKRGVAVTSEQLRYPFIGKLAVTMNGPGKSNCPFGGEAVPLLPTIYRGAAIWGGSGDGKIHPQQEIFWNTRSALWFQADTDRTKIADFYYLVVLPFGKLHKLAVESYESSGNMRRLVLERESEVTMDTTSESYVAKADGVEIARDNATFCPIDENRIAFYSRTRRTLRHPLPASWNPATLTARTLTLEGRSICKVQCADGMIVVEVEAKRPVIVYSSESAIPAS